MKKILIYIILILPISISAQVELSNAELRKFNYRIVDLLEEYEFHLQTPTDRARQEFLALFESTDTLVYNDLLGLSFDKQLTVEEYADLLYSNSNACKIVTRDFKKQDITETSTHYLVDVTFDKYIQYYNKCGILFDSKDFYKADHKITATIAMDKENGNVLIRTIKGSIDSNQPSLPKEYNVYEYNEPRDNQITADGKALTYNIFGQAVVGKNAKIKFHDNDVVLKIVQEDTDCNLYSFKYKPRRWRIRPKAEFTFGGNYKFGGDLGDELLKSESMLEFGVDFGYAVIAKPKFKMGLFIGVGMSNSNMEFEQEGTYKYSYLAPATADYDGETYKRHYEISNMKAKMEMMQFVVPLYLDLDYQFSKYFSTYMQLGAKSYITSKLNVTGLTADVYTYGVYKQYDDLKIENFVNNNFRQQSITVNEQEIEAESLVIDAFGSLGFRVRLFGGFYLDAGISYQMSVTPLVKTDNQVSLGSNVSINEDEALITYTCKDGEQVRPFTDIFEKITRGSIKANVGILFKF